MCDPLTEAENAAFLKAAALNRRQVTMIGSSALAVGTLSACGGIGIGVGAGGFGSGIGVGAGVSTSLGGRAEVPPKGAMVQIALTDGPCDAFFVAPSSGKHPAVILWPDVAGLRDAYHQMATRLAGEGYAVLEVNPYYRAAKSPVLSTFAEWRTEAGQATIAPMRAALTPDAITRDAAGLVAWLDQQPQVDTARKIAAIGYCMGGPFTFRTAAAAPGRVGAIASFHGGGLATDAPDSPHLLIAKFNAAMLIAIAQNDDERDPKAKETLRAAADASGRFAEIEVYPAQHGWCTIDSPVYDVVQADRAWGRMVALFEANL